MMIAKTRAEVLVAKLQRGDKVLATNGHSLEILGDWMPGCYKLAFDTQTGRRTTLAYTATAKRAAK